MQIALNCGCSLEGGIALIYSICTGDLNFDVFCHIVGLQLSKFIFIGARLNRYLEHIAIQLLINFQFTCLVLNTSQNVYTSSDTVVFVQKHKRENITEIQIIT
ncbi:Hypothetical_protein [Hexamita inflata]|uniref:Hypothetical_protein n=1 Tax=Hexamita inflata TaxID=28002 RepID=A0AA86PG49_9EUKA|nr:Hypothetical protein HINF_LOCUS22822 [Hexamita inflata]